MPWNRDRSEIGKGLTIYLAATYDKAAWLRAVAVRKTVGHLSSVKVPHSSQNERRSMSKKLYIVKCKGMTFTYGYSYVVAEHATEAYNKVRESLDNRDLGFSKERELQQIELVAECTDYPDCGTILYLD